MRPVHQPWRRRNSSGVKRVQSAGGIRILMHSPTTAVCRLHQLRTGPDRGEIACLSTAYQLELPATKRRINQLQNEVFLSEGVHPKALPGDRRSHRTGHQRSPRLPCVGSRSRVTRPGTTGPSRPSDAAVPQLSDDRL
jgi:hypothetical protein